MPHRSPLHPKHPMSPAFHRGRLHFEQPRGGFCDHRPLHGHAALALPSNRAGGFATIDPRHAGDTPHGSAYGSNSPQATNKDKPHHQPPRHPRHRQRPHPLKHPQHRPRRPRNTTRRRNHAQTVVHYTPNTPCHPHSTEVDCTLSNHSGGFATIDPRHAGDTPQRSAYGSNSPQATNKNKPHHHDKQTKTCRTRPTLPPKGPACAQTGHHSPINPTTTPPATTANPSHHTGMQPRNRATARRWDTARV